MGLRGLYKLSVELQRVGDGLVSEALLGISRFRMSF